MLHRRRQLPASTDLVEIGGITVTAPARTIVDLASLQGPAGLRHVIQTQVRAAKPTPAELIGCFEAVARRGVTGVGLLRRLLASLFDEQPVLGSILEERVVHLLSTEGIGGFVPQFRPPWYDGRAGIVDFAHPGLQLVLEADGRRWHQRDQEMAIDRRRDRVAAGHGWLTVRVIWAEITERPLATADELRHVIAPRRRVAPDRAARRPGRDSEVRRHR